MRLEKKILMKSNSKYRKMNREKKFFAQNSFLSDENNEDETIPPPAQPIDLTEITTKLDNLYGSSSDESESESESGSSSHSIELQKISSKKSSRLARISKRHEKRHNKSKALETLSSASDWLTDTIFESTEPSKTFASTVASPVSKFVYVPVKSSSDRKSRKKNSNILLSLAESSKAIANISDNAEMDDNSPHSSTTAALNPSSAWLSVRSKKSSKKSIRTVQSSSSLSSDSSNNISIMTGSSLTSASSIPQSLTPLAFPSMAQSSTFSFGSTDSIVRPKESTPRLSILPGQSVFSKSFSMTPTASGSAVAVTAPPSSVRSAETEKSMALSLTQSIFASQLQIFVQQLSNSFYSHIFPKSRQKNWDDVDSEDDSDLSEDECYEMSWDSFSDIDVGGERDQAGNELLSLLSSFRPYCLHEMLDKKHISRPDTVDSAWFNQYIKEALLASQDVADLCGSLLAVSSIGLSQPSSERINAFVKSKIPWSTRIIVRLCQDIIVEDERIVSSKGKLLKAMYRNGLYSILDSPSESNVKKKDVWIFWRKTLLEALIDSLCERWHRCISSQQLSSRLQLEVNEIGNAPFFQYAACSGVDLSIGHSSKRHTATEGLDANELSRENTDFLDTVVVRSIQFCKHMNEKSNGSKGMSQNTGGVTVPAAKDEGGSATICHDHFKTSLDVFINFVDIEAFEFKKDWNELVVGFLSSDDFIDFLRRRLKRKTISKVEPQIEEFRDESATKSSEGESDSEDSVSSHDSSVNNSSDDSRDSENDNDNENMNDNDNDSRSQDGSNSSDNVSDRNSDRDRDSDSDSVSHNSASDFCEDSDSECASCCNDSGKEDEDINSIDNNDNDNDVLASLLCNVNEVLIRIEYLVDSFFPQGFRCLSFFMRNYGYALGVSTGTADQPAILKRLLEVWENLFRFCRLVSNTVASLTALIEYFQENELISQFSKTLYYPFHRFFTQNSISFSSLLSLVLDCENWFCCDVCKDLRRNWPNDNSYRTSAYLQVFHIVLRYVSPLQLYPTKSLFSEFSVGNSLVFPSIDSNLSFLLGKVINSLSGHHYKLSLQCMNILSDEEVLKAFFFPLYCSESSNELFYWKLGRMNQFYYANEENYRSENVEEWMDIVGSVLEEGQFDHIIYQAKEKLLYALAAKMQQMKTEFWHPSIRAKCASLSDDLFEQIQQL